MRRQPDRLQRAWDRLRIWHWSTDRVEWELASRNDGRRDCTVILQTLVDRLPVVDIPTGTYRGRAPIFKNAGQQILGRRA